MFVKRELVSKISEVASNFSGLDPIELAKSVEAEERRLGDASREITTLRSKAFERDETVEPSPIDAHDGSFERLLGREAVSENPSEPYDDPRERTVRNVEAFRTLTAALRDTETPGIETSDVLRDLILQSLDLREARSNLLRLQESLDRLKMRAGAATAHPYLTDTVRRDLAFESEMRKARSRIDDFNRYVDAAKKIEKLCREEYSGTEDDSTRPPPVIAALLKEVETALLLDEHQSVL